MDDHGQFLTENLTKHINVLQERNLFISTLNLNHYKIPQIKWNIMVIIQARSKVVACKLWFTENFYGLKHFKEKHQSNENQTLISNYRHDFTGYYTLACTIISVSRANYFRFCIYKTNK